MAVAAALLPLLTLMSLMGIARTLRTRSLLYFDLLLAPRVTTLNLFMLLQSSKPRKLL